MNETEIAAQVAQNIPKEEHIPAPIVEEKPQPSAFDSNVALEDPTFALRLQDYFDVPRIERYNEETQKQLRSVYEWAAQRAGSADLNEVLPIIRMLENELGATFTTDKLQRLAKFIKLQKQSEVLRIQQEALYA
jgi:hypothetical protein